jgi:glycosyltransferase involved in cell wall biosynthesis
MSISVIIPAYNSERFVRRCLESVYAQTLQPDEIILVDDGSTDNTAERAEELGAQVIRRKNGGPSAARNRGIECATSEWIALLDADDSWSPQKLERQMACVRPETVLVYTGIHMFDERGAREKRLATDGVTAKEMLRYCNPILPSSVLLRRDAILRVGGFREDNRGCEDWDMWVRLKNWGAFIGLPDALTNYYLHPNSISANPDTMLRAVEGILETTLVADLRGLDRWAWRQRIRATQFASAGLIARANGVENEMMLLVRSLCAWPSPFWQPKRFAVLAVSAKNRVHERLKKS